MTGLSVWTDDHDTIVATDILDAEAVWKETIGNSYEDEVGDPFAENWRQVGPDEVITIRDDEGNGPETKRAKEWAESNGRGFLCSTDF